MTDIGPVSQPPADSAARISVFDVGTVLILVTTHAALAPMIVFVSERDQPGEGEQEAGSVPCFEEAERLFAGGHHARLIDERVPLHIISRVFQGRHLLRPEPALNDLILGVVGRAQVLFPDVELFALAVMSNHIHAMARGPAHALPFFIGYIKREISRRFGHRPDIDWPDGMWRPYIATALPTEESQIRCFKYIAAQGTKELLVERPQDWPGVHTVKASMLGRTLRGTWLNATGYFRAQQAQARKQRPEPVRRADFLHTYEVVLSPLPAWSALDEETRRARVAALVEQICVEARKERDARGRQALGAAAVMRVSRERRTALPKQPWFEKRKRMICWADPRAPEARAYLRAYWDFQLAFKAASRRLKDGALDTEFPARAFRPMSYHPPPRPAPSP